MNSYFVCNMTNMCGHDVTLAKVAVDDVHETLVGAEDALALALCSRSHCQDQF